MSVMNKWDKLKLKQYGEVQIRITSVTKSLAEDLISKYKAMPNLKVDVIKYSFSEHYCDFMVNVYEAN